MEIEAGIPLSVQAFFKVLVFKYKKTRNFSRIGVVTDLSWFQNKMKIKDLLIDTKGKAIRSKKG